MEAFSPSLSDASNGADESNLDAPAQRSEINQVSPVQFEVAKSKKTRGDTLMKILWGIGMDRTQSSVSQIAHDDTAAWEKIGEECVRMNGGTLCFAAIFMCPALIIIIIYVSNSDPQPSVASLVAQRSIEVSFITSSLLVVLMAYNTFIVGKRGIAEALQAGRYGRILFICVAAKVMLWTATTAMYIHTCVAVWITNLRLPRALRLLIIILVISNVLMMAGCSMKLIYAEYVREPSPGDSHTQIFPPTIV